MVSLIASPGPCYERTHMGVTGLESTLSALVAQAEIAVEDGTYDYTFYESRDGGISWHPASAFEPATNHQPLEARKATEPTPQGTFVIRGNEIVRQTPTETSSIYSANHMTLESSKLTLARATTDLADDTHTSRQLAFRPAAIAYDPQTGNVVAAMGILGTVAIQPDGITKPASVGPYHPVDLSPKGKLMAFAEQPILWSSAIALATTALAVVFGAARLFHPLTWDNLARLIIVVIPAITGAAFLTGLTLEEAIALPDNNDRIPGTILATGAVALAALCIWFSRRDALPLPRRDLWAAEATLVFMIAITVCSHLSWTYRDPMTPSPTVMSVAGCAIIATLLAILHTKETLATYRDERKASYRRAPSAVRDRLAEIRQEISQDVSRVVPKRIPRPNPRITVRGQVDRRTAEAMAEEAQHTARRETTD